ELEELQSWGARRRRGRPGWREAEPWVLRVRRVKTPLTLCSSRPQDFSTLAVMRMITAILFSLSIGSRCQILKIVLELVLELELEWPEHLAPEPRCTLRPWVSQRHN